MGASTAVGRARPFRPPRPETGPSTPFDESSDRRAVGARARSAAPRPRCTSRGPTPRARRGSGRGGAPARRTGLGPRSIANLPRPRPTAAVSTDRHGLDRLLRSRPTRSRPLGTSARPARERVERRHEEHARKQRARRGHVRVALAHGRRRHEALLGLDENLDERHVPATATPISAVRAPFLLIFVALDGLRRPLEVHSKVRTSGQDFGSAAGTA